MHFQQGDAIEFGIGLPGLDFLVSGWSNPEPGFVWSEGKLANLVLPLTQSVPWVGMTMRSLVAANITQQRVQVRLNGVRVPDILFRDGKVRDVMLEIPRKVQAKLDKVGELRISFSCPDAVSPASLGLRQDARLLAVQLRKIWL